MVLIFPYIPIVYTESSLYYFIALRLLAKSGMYSIFLLFYEIRKWKFLFHVSGIIQYLSVPTDRKSNRKKDCTVRKSINTMCIFTVHEELKCIAQTTSCGLCLVSAAQKQYKLIPQSITIYQAYHLQSMVQWDHCFFPVRLCSRRSTPRVALNTLSCLKIIL